MRLLKIIVGVMTLLLLAGLAVLVVGLTLGWHKRDGETSVTTGTASLPVEVTIPHGCLLYDIEPGGDYALVRLSGGGHCERVIVLNLARGQVQSSFVFVPEPTKCLDNPPVGETESPCP